MEKIALETFERITKELSTLSFSDQNKVLAGIFNRIKQERTARLESLQLEIKELEEAISLSDGLMMEIIRGK
jgi:hypothetical protein